MAGDRLEVLARIDEVDDRDLDLVAAILLQAGGGNDELLDFLDLLVDRLGRRLVAERRRAARRG